MYKFCKKLKPELFTFPICYNRQYRGDIIKPKFSEYIYVPILTIPGNINYIILMWQ